MIHKKTHVFSLPGHPARFSRGRASTLEGIGEPFGRVWVPSGSIWSTFGHPWAGAGGTKADSGKARVSWEASGKFVGRRDKSSIPHINTTCIADVAHGTQDASPYTYVPCGCYDTSEIPLTGTLVHNGHQWSYRPSLPWHMS